MFNSTVSLSHFHPTKSFFVSASCGLKAEKNLGESNQEAGAVGIGLPKFACTNKFHQQTHSQAFWASLSQIPAYAGTQG